MVTIFLVPFIIGAIIGVVLKFIPYKAGVISGKVLGYAGGIIGLILTALIFANTKTKDGIDDKFINQILYLSYYLMTAAAGLWVGYALSGTVIALIERPKSQIKAFASLAVMLIIVFICYKFFGTSDFDLRGKSFEEVELYKSIPKAAYHWSDTSIYVSYFLMFIAVISIFVTEIIRLFK